MISGLADGLLIHLTSSLDAADEKMGLGQNRWSSIADGAPRTRPREALI